jgi:hypothetical protein
MEIREDKRVTKLKTSSNAQQNLSHSPRHFVLSGSSALLTGKNRCRVCRTLQREWERASMKKSN